MSEPTPADVPPQGGSKAADKAKPPALLTVGHFVHRDHLLGGEHDRFGVVVAVGDVLEVYPLERYTVNVDPAGFTPIKPDELEG